MALVSTIASVPAERVKPTLEAESEYGGAVRRGAHSGSRNMRTNQRRKTQSRQRQTPGTRRMRPMPTAVGDGSGSVPTAERAPI